MNRLLIVTVAGLLWTGSFAASVRADQIYQASDPNRPDDAQYGKYALVLNGFFDGNHQSFVTFSFTNVRFLQGTATASLQGLITVNNSPDPSFLGLQYNLNVGLRHITDPAELARIVNYNPNYQYYSIQSTGRELVNVNNSRDVASLVDFPRDGTMPMYVGIGGDSQDADQNLLGGSEWPGWRHGQFEGMTDGTHGDVNFLLSVPEPPTMVLALTGVAGLGLVAGRRALRRRSGSA
jgi:hypothetical protein